MPRILFLLFSLSVMTMMFVAKFGLDSHFQQATQGNPSGGQRPESRIVRDLLKDREFRHRKEVSILRDRIGTLEKELETAEEQVKNLTQRAKVVPPTVPEITSKEILEGKTLMIQNKTEDFIKYFKEKIIAAEIHQGVALKTEYDIVAFDRFTLNRVYMHEPGLGKRVIEKPIGYKKRDLFEVVAFGVEQLNVNRSDDTKPYSFEDFLEGVYRTEPTSGSHYELYFRNKDVTTPYSYIKLVMMRPFGPPMLVTNRTMSTHQEWINLILPLSGRVETFRLFMERFIGTCIKQDKRVYLTVVYFGKEGLSEVKTIMSQIAKTYRFKHMKLVTLNEKFARGRGLQIGALNWKSGDTLIFLCDVDIVFNNEFLERCRLNAERGKRVYYPIVFSLYNPNVVYALQDLPIPSLKDQLIISKDTGFWRDFGYGMTCQFRSDFLKIKGFDEQIIGWGGEDVFLYQKYVRSDYMVIRATDPGIFHLWHEKECDPNLSSEQYKSCIRSKALNEASHSQLGLLAFKDEVDVHKGFENSKKKMVL